MQLRCGRHTLDLSHPLVMGILNVTPDSFSDGGQFIDVSKARRARAAHDRAGRWHDRCGRRIHTTRRR